MTVRAGCLHVRKIGARMQRVSVCTVVNFSHRIDRFSFSEEPRGSMSLDGDSNRAESGEQRVYVVAGGDVAVVTWQ